MAAKNFLRRWSRRKQAAATRAPDGPKIETGAPLDGTTKSPADQPAFDPKILPPIESITAESDIRAFLAPGVPEELSRAALRRAWTSDPTIRDFIGLAENQWDFTRPDSVPGFGSLEWTPEIARLAHQLIGEAPKEPGAHPGSEEPGCAPDSHVGAYPYQQTGAHFAGTCASAEIVEPSAELPPPMTSATAADDATREPEGLDMRSIMQRNNDDIATREQGAEANERFPQRKHGSALPK